jgi:hypothetical protein
MSRKKTERLIRAATRPLWERDQLEMRAVSALFSVMGPKPRRRRTPTKRRRPSIKSPR